METHLLAEATFKAARDLRQRDAEHAAALSSLRERCANWLRQVKEEWSRGAGLFERAMIPMSVVTRDMPPVGPIS